MQIVDGIEEVTTCAMPRISNPITSNFNHDVLSMPKAEDEPILVFLLGKGEYLIVQVCHHPDVEFKVKDIITQRLVTGLLRGGSVGHCLIDQMWMEHKLALLQAFIAKMRESPDDETEWLWKRVFL